jgi:hypothetical protein
MLFRNFISGSGVYKISNLNTHRIYIGSAEDLIDRYETHMYALLGNYHHSNTLQEFWNKEPCLNMFYFDIIEQCSIDKLEEREQYYLDTLLKASENNSEFYRLAFNKSRSSKRNTVKAEKPLLQYSLEGDFIKEWRSGLQASKDLNLSYTGIIQCAINNTKKRFLQSGGFQWRSWKENYPLKIPLYKYEHFLQKRLEVTNVITGEVKVFNGKREASKQLNIPRSMINRCIKNNKIHIKYQLKFKEI